VALLAVGTLIVNDQVLKAAWPGVLTGKFGFDALYQQHLNIGKYRNFGLAFRMNM
jgi:hypothetical protein